jgi:hypothetical protein
MATQHIDSEMQPTTDDTSDRSNTITKSKEGAIELDPVAGEYLQGGRLAIIIVSLLLGMFLVALDNVSDKLSYQHYPKLIKSGARPFSARPSLE